MVFRGKPLAALVAASLIVLGCVGAPDTTSPEGPQLAVTQTASSCDATLATEIRADIDAMSSASTRAQLKNQWSKVEKACSNLTTAAAEQKKYLQLTIDKFYTGNLSHPTLEQLLVLHWDKTAVFVGEPAYGLAPTVLSDAGAVMVIGPQGNGFVDLVNEDKTAGIRVNKSAISNTHLFSIAPADCSGFQTTTNLDLYPLCFDFDVNPVTTFVDPWVQLAVCAAENSPGATLARGVLAANHEGTVKVAVKAADPFNLDCSNAIAPPEPSSFLGRLAWSAFEWLSPAKAFAIHAGTSGRPVGELSVWGVADPVVFLRTFTDDVIGQPPGAPVAPDKGTWTVVSEDPGSVLIQASLGDILSKLAVINQQGGNCANCGGLTFTGTVDGNPDDTPADNGIYLVRWRSVISTPNVGYVPIILRGKPAPGAKDTLEIGRIEYRPAQAAQSGPITFNGTIPVGTWSRNVSQLFELTVDLYANTVSLSINGVEVTAVKNLPFRNSAASDLYTIAIEIIGNDVQTVGWDDVEIRRLADLPAGFTP